MTGSGRAGGSKPEKRPSDGRKRILCAGRFGFADSAAGIRAANNARLLEKCGFEVRLLCDTGIPGFRDGTRGGLRYTFLQPLPSAAANAVQLVTGQRFFEKTAEVWEEFRPDAVIITDCLNGYAEKTARFCEKNGTVIISECTEWYERLPLSCGTEALVPCSVGRRIRSTDVKKIRRIIAVSPYLRDYYESRGCEVMLLPPVVPMRAESVERRRDGDGFVLNLVYAGFPGKNKDFIGPLIEAADIAVKAGARLRIDIAGPPRGGAGVPAEGRPFVFEHGRLSHEEAAELVRKADFSVLLRGDTRSAKAGFSSKFAESMRLGTAVLCSRAGGADTLIEDETDGALADSCDPSAIAAKLLRLYSLGEEKIIGIRKNALEKADLYFDPDRYVRPLAEFMGRCGL